MGDRTGIEWTDATWNPIRGCTRVSDGCRNCYAEVVAPCPLTAPSARTPGWCAAGECRAKSEHEKYYECPDCFRGREDRGT